MKKPSPTTKPRFADDQDSLIDPLPIFITRTTLRTIIKQHKIERLPGLSANLTPFALSRPSTSDISEPEYPSIKPLKYILPRLCIA